MADELLDVHRDTEVMTEDVLQSFGVPHLADQRADMKELGKIRHLVAIASRAGGHADERADVHREAVGRGAVAIDVRLRLRPRAIEQCEEAVMEDVEEP